MYFTIESRQGGYRALAYGANHEKLFWSEIYVRKAGAQHVINLMKSGAAMAPVYDRT